MNELEKAELRLKQAQERVKKLKSRQKEKDRKEDTRRKILLGAELLNLVQKEPHHKALLNRLIDQMPERNKALFADLREKRS
ncbi:hypothetical protein [Breoghania sp. JC706]|uniref:hypothetical protein n=1 Tax=Breoghania sp. JC706 TaxID=3117732 RepID=UPI00300AE849